MIEDDFSIAELHFNLLFFLELAEEQDVTDGDAGHIGEALGEVEVFGVEGLTIHFINEGKDAEERGIGDERDDEHAPAVGHGAADALFDFVRIEDEGALLRDCFDERCFIEGERVLEQVSGESLRIVVGWCGREIEVVVLEWEGANDRFGEEEALGGIVAEESSGLNAEGAGAVISVEADESGEFERVLEGFGGFAEEIKNAVVCRGETAA